MAESAEHATSDLSTGGADDSGRVVDGAAVGGAETETKAEAEQHHDTGAVALRLASSDADPPAVDDDGEEESKGEAVAFDVPLDECPVCFDEPARTVQLACGHAFCLECAGSAVDAVVKAARGDALQCLDADCRAAVLDDASVMAILQRRGDAGGGGDDGADGQGEVAAGSAARVHAKYVEFKRARDVAASPHLCFCPMPDCGAVVERPDGHKPGVEPISCASCSEQFCWACRKRWSDVAPVSGEAVPTKAVKKKSKVAEELKRQGHYCSLDDEGGGMRQFAEQRGMKQCPKCEVWVERGIQGNRGCAHMRCFNCRAQWCWHCRASLDDPNVRHFQGFRCPNTGEELNGPPAAMYLCSCLLMLLALVCCLPMCLLSAVALVIRCLAEACSCCTCCRELDRRCARTMRWLAEGPEVYDEETQEVLEIAERLENGTLWSPQPRAVSDALPVAPEEGAASVAAGGEAGTS